MDDKDKTPEQMAAPGAPAEVNAAADQKSDKSPEELMAQVSEASGTLEGGEGSKMSSVDAMADESNQDKQFAKRTEEKGFKKLVKKFNVYLLLFIFLVIISGVSTGVFYVLNKREQEVRLETTELTEEALEEIKTSDATVGDPRQILTIESNAVISGKVVMRDTLDVAGALRIGGALSIPSIRATGDGNFGSLSTNDLQAAGNVSIGGVLDVVGAATFGNNLSAAGNINGGGRLDIGGAATIGGNLNVNGVISAEGLNFESISITRLNITGPTPSISVAGAAGGGATASISGSDTAGTATINTGGGTGTGILATITFTGAFSSTNPHAVITPNGPGCANIAYYVTNFSATQFSIASATAPPAGTACRFNYVVIN